MGPSVFRPYGVDVRRSDKKWAACFLRRLSPSAKPLCVRFGSEVAMPLLAVS